MASLSWPSWLGLSRIPGGIVVVAGAGGACARGACAGGACAGGACAGGPCIVAACHPVRDLGSATAHYSDSTKILTPSHFTANPFSEKQYVAPNGGYIFEVADSRASIHRLKLQYAGTQIAKLPPMKRSYTTNSLAIGKGLCCTVDIRNVRYKIQNPLRAPINVYSKLKAAPLTTNFPTSLNAI
jgi:hypothetical protein